MLVAVSCNCAQTCEQKVTTVAVDTSNAGLKIYYPNFTSIDLVCGTVPSADDDSVIMFCEAAFTNYLMDEFTHKNIQCSHASGGVFYKGARTQRNNGAFVYYDGNWKFVHRESNPSVLDAAIDSAAAHGGMGFCQEMFIHNGLEVEHTRKTRIAISSEPCAALTENSAWPMPLRLAPSVISSITSSPQESRRLFTLIWAVAGTIRGIVRIPVTPRSSSIPRPTATSPTGSRSIIRRLEFWCVKALLPQQEHYTPYLLSLRALIPSTRSFLPQNALVTNLNALTRSMSPKNALVAGLEAFSKSIMPHNCSRYEPQSL